MIALLEWVAALFGLARLGQVGADITRGTFWMPSQSSTTAAGVDSVFYFIFWICALFFALIVGLTVLFLVRYRARPGHRAERSPSHSMPLELAWSIIPSILVMAMFWLGFQSFMDQYNPPPNAYEVLVRAQKWNWEFEYPNGYIDADLHVPVGRDIKLVMSSQDVIHSFFVPAFRMKKDVVPGRFNAIWFRATEPGQYVAFCTEYCGTGHSDMMANVVVHPAGEFERWLDDAANFLDTLPPVEAGKLLYEQRGCTQCHSVDGTPMVGPSFLGLGQKWGEEEQMADGSTVIVDEDYIRESIVDPQAKLVAGYEPVMPSYAGRLSDKEISYISRFIKSLGGHEDTDEAGESSEAEAAENEE